MKWAFVTLVVVAFLAYAYAWYGRNGSERVSDMQVQIPLLIDASNTDYTGPVIGCDKVVMTEKTVPKTPQVLDAALKKLFAREDVWEPWTGRPGNFLSAHTNLSYDHVALVDGAASIYLTGEVGPLGGVCDDPRLRTTLEQTALQFPSVISVQFYLNGKPTDFSYSGK